MTSIILPGQSKTATQSRDEQTGRHLGRKGDIFATLVYRDVHKGGDPEACIKIDKVNKSDKEYACIIPMSQMWMWDDPEYMVGLAGRAAMRLYSFVTLQDCNRVIELVQNFMPELKNAPPEPTKPRTFENFLEDCDRDGLKFFMELNGERKYL